MKSGLMNVFVSEVSVLRVRLALDHLYKQTAEIYDVLLVTKDQASLKDGVDAIKGNIDNYLVVAQLHNIVLVFINIVLDISISQLRIDVELNIFPSGFPHGHIIGKLKKLSALKCIQNFHLNIIDKDR